MNKRLRVFILISVLVGILGLARNQEAGAQPSMEIDRSVQAQDISSAPDQDIYLGHDGGTVKPPPSKEKICKNGDYTIGGVAVLRVRNLAKEYCLLVSLKKYQQASGRVPHGAGKILADITLFQVVYRHHHVSNLPAKDGNVELCYAIPPGKEAGIYFLHRGRQLWQPIDTTVNKGIACARIHASGSYALIGK